MATWEDASAEDAADASAADASAEALIVPPRGRVCAVRRWTRRESMWLVAHITKEKLATGKRIGNWAATASAFEATFGYARSEKSFATQAARLRDEPERLQRQPRERQADGVASERPPETRTRAVQPQPRDWSAEQRARETRKRAVQPQPRDWSAEQRARDVQPQERESRAWTSSETSWLTARLEEHRASVTQRLADGAQYKAGAACHSRGKGARGGVDWEGLATAHEALFGKSRSGMALRHHHRQDQQQKRALLQQQDTSAEEFALLQQQDTSAEVFRLLDM